MMITGWWFGTWILFSIIYMGQSFALTFRFFRGVETTNQWCGLKIDVVWTCYTEKTSKSSGYRKSCSLLHEILWLYINYISRFQTDPCMSNKLWHSGWLGRHFSWSPTFNVVQPINNKPIINLSCLFGFLSFGDGISYGIS